MLDPETEGWMGRVDNLLLRLRVENRYFETGKFTRSRIPILTHPSDPGSGVDVGWA